MKKLSIAYIFIFLTFFAFKIKAQNDSAFQYLKTIQGAYSYFTVDNLDNIFLITTNNQLKKIDSNGDSVGVYNNLKQYGTLFSIDVSNPLKILLYYKDFTTAVILDRLLNTRNTINFRNQNMFSVPCIATSYDNNMWLFDADEFKIKKMEDAGNLLQASTDFRLLFDSVPNPTQIIDKDNFIYLYDAKSGIYIFDYYGAFKNKLSFLNWNNVAVFNKTIYGFNQNKLCSYTLNSFNLKEYVLPSFFINCKSIKLCNGKIYLLKEDGIYIYLVK